MWSYNKPHPYPNDDWYNLFEPIKLNKKYKNVKSISVFEMAKMIKERCNTVLGFEPILKYSKKEPCEQQEPLEFCVDSLANLGITLEGNINLEIDELLHSCTNWFKSS